MAFILLVSLFFPRSREEKRNSLSLPVFPSDSMLFRFSLHLFHLTLPLTHRLGTEWNSSERMKRRAKADRPLKNVRCQWATHLFIWIDAKSDHRVSICHCVVSSTDQMSKSRANWINNDSGEGKDIFLFLVRPRTNTRRKRVERPCCRRNEYVSRLRIDSSLSKPSAENLVSFPSPTSSSVSLSSPGVDNTPSRSSYQSFREV